MNTTWHQLKNLDKSDSIEISADTAVMHDSLWFDGHFPGTPILPGIAQLAIVSDMLKEHAARSGGNIDIVAIRRVRFRQFIRPGDRLRMSAEADRQEPGAYKFRVTVNGQIACNGIMMTAPRKS
jgi:3-hydroxyacyl-[acyl-carrier-protein] dehydratase